MRNYQFIFNSYHGSNIPFLLLLKTKNLGYISLKQINISLTDITCSYGK